MLNLLFFFALAAGAAWIAYGAFTKPEGVYWKSAAGLVLGVFGAGATWQLASPWIANEAGLGALVLFLMASTVFAIAALVAVLAATARHVWNALAARGA